MRYQIVLKTDSFPCVLDIMTILHFFDSRTFSETRHKRGLAVSKKKKSQMWISKSLRNRINLLWHLFVNNLHCCHFLLQNPQVLMLITSVKHLVNKQLLHRNLRSYSMTTSIVKWHNGKHKCSPHIYRSWQVSKEYVILLSLPTHQLCILIVNTEAVAERLIKQELLEANSCCQEWHGSGLTNLTKDLSSLVHLYHSTQTDFTWWKLRSISSTASPNYYHWYLSLCLSISLLQTAANPDGSSNPA